MIDRAHPSGSLECRGALLLIVCAGAIGCVAREDSTEADAIALDVAQAEDAGSRCRADEDCPGGEACIWHFPGCGPDFELGVCGVHTNVDACGFACNARCSCDGMTYDSPPSRPFAHHGPCADYDGGERDDGALDDAGASTDAPLFDDDTGLMSMDGGLADAGLRCTSSSDCPNGEPCLWRTPGCDPSHLGVCGTFPMDACAGCNWFCGCDGLSYEGAPRRRYSHRDKCSGDDGGADATPIDAPLGDTGSPDFGVADLGLSDRGVPDSGLGGRCRDDNDCNPGQNCIWRTPGCGPEMQLGECGIRTPLDACGGCNIYCSCDGVTAQGWATGPFRSHSACACEPGDDAGTCGG